MTQLFEIDGQKKTVAEWAVDYGIPYSTLINRRRKGMTLEEALKQPRNYREPKKKDVSVCDPRKCRRCAYAFGRGRGQVCCDYLTYTGHRRPCPAGACTVFKRAKT